MRTKEEIEDSLKEMERMAEAALRGKSIAMKKGVPFLVEKFEEWRIKCKARAQILKWVLEIDYIIQDNEMPIT